MLFPFVTIAAALAATCILPVAGSPRDGKHDVSKMRNGNKTVAGIPNRKCQHGNVLFDQVRLSIRMARVTG